jgi:RNA polymerase sigma-70 factor (ECF subfamily)
MPDPQDDHLIVTTVLNGDRDAFEQIVRRYHGPLRRVALHRTGRADLADDIVQETFLAAYRSLHTYNSVYSFRTWLWTILINQCRRHGRREAKHSVQIFMNGSQLADRKASWNGSAAPMVSEVPTPGARLEASERTRHLHALLEQLPESRADAVRLRFFGELKYREIADTLNCSLSAAKKWVREGLVAMSEVMRKSNSAYQLPDANERET